MKKVDTSIIYSTIKKERKKEKDQNKNIRTLTDECREFFWLREGTWPPCTAIKKKHAGKELQVLTANSLQHVEGMQQLDSFPPHAFILSQRRMCLSSVQN